MIVSTGMQLGERYNGIVEVRGSIPLGSTKTLFFYIYKKHFGHRFYIFLLNLCWVF
jgi:hypothetical protein